MPAASSSLIDPAIGQLLDLVVEGQAAKVSDPAELQVSGRGESHYSISSGFPCGLSVSGVRNVAWAQRSRIFLRCCRRVDVLSL
jgi:hypothetical protein